ncbi:ATL5 protein, partial [Polyodon spathula]|nr:ATL5 protein [Polyodon spathula]
MHFQIEWNRGVLRSLLLLALLTAAPGSQVRAGRGRRLEVRLGTQIGRQAVVTEWGSWGQWSGCSSTCGEGVSFRTRTCIRFSDGQRCPDEQRQYRVCSQQPCSSNAGDFRAMQCSLYNRKPILGNGDHYQWVPFLGAPNPCDLHCLADGHNFYYTFGRALDGTSCHPQAEGVCVNGGCLVAGCDGVLGSGSRRDVCAVCGGRNDSCYLERRVFQGRLPSPGFFGYINVTRIPAGATSIRVTDSSRNYLAVLAADRRYLLNGDWLIDAPGVYAGAGTTLHYRRSYENHETLEAEGPTAEELHILVLLQEQAPSIEYEFWLPRGRYGDFSSMSSPLRQAEGAVMEGPVSPVSAARGQTSPQTPGIPYSLLPATQTSKPRLHMQKETDTSSRTHFSDSAQHTGTCGVCRAAKGKSRRAQLYCSSDFVFRVKILSRVVQGSETRLEVQVKQTYKNRFGLVHREFVWLPDACACPPVLEHREYVLMAVQHVNHERTLNRILVPSHGYARLWSPREDRLLRELDGHCR